MHRKVTPSVCHYYLNGSIPKLVIFSDMDVMYLNIWRSSWSVSAFWTTFSCSRLADQYSIGELFKECGCMLDSLKRGRSNLCWWKSRGKHIYSLLSQGESTSLLNFTADLCTLQFLSTCPKNLYSNHCLLVTARVWPELERSALLQWNGIRVTFLEAGLIV